MYGVPCLESLSKSISTSTRWPLLGSGLNGAVSMAIVERNLYLLHRQTLTEGQTSDSMRESRVTAPVDRRHQSRVTL